MKRICSFLLIAALIITAIPFSGLSVYATTFEFAGGSGTEEDPYLIETKYHLNNVRNYLDAHYKMIADIEFTEADFAEGGDFYNDGQGFLPIGDGWNSTFTGKFDGDKHIVKNLYINVSSTSSAVYAGLFARNEGSISNLGMEGGKVSATSLRDDTYVGGIVGCNDNYIGYCYNTGEVSAYSDYFLNIADAYAGGITGFDGKNITSCYNTGKVSASSSSNNASAGGISGAGYYVDEITGCYNTGKVSASSDSNYSYAGGIVGWIEGQVKTCYNSGVVSALAYSSAIPFSGGISGKEDDGAIENCYNAGKVSASSESSNIYVGGIAGYSHYVQNCYNVGEISFTGNSTYNYAGGISGYNSVMIYRCYYLDVISKGAGYGKDPATICTSDEMKFQSTYIGFDFNSVWTMAGNECYLYPKLCTNIHSMSDHYYDNACDTTCDCGYVREITHDYLLVIEENGHFDKCTICGYKTNIINHIYADVCDATCDCGYERTPPHNCEPNYNKTTHYDECIDCGSKLNVQEHEFDSPCDSTCDCGYIRTISHNYKPSFDDDCHFDKCTLCEDKINVVEHTYVNVCDSSCDCSYTRTAPHDYELRFDSEYHYDKCTICGEIANSYIHIYDNKCDAFCNHCSYERIPNPHKVDIYTISAKSDFRFISGDMYMSMNIANGSMSYVNLTALNKGSIKIEYYTSTEKDYDRLTIKHNNIVKVTQSGITSWNTITIPVVEGDKISIAYSKNGSKSSGLDQVFFKLDPVSGYFMAEDLEPTCEDDVVCDECGVIVKEALGHTYSSECDIKCDICQKERTALGQHVFDNACDTVCNSCGYKRTITHSYQPAFDDSKHFNKCTICGYAINSYSHSYSSVCDATCDCGYTRTPPHDYQTNYDKNKHFDECTVCGDVINRAAHEYDNVYDPRCDCGHIRAVEIIMADANIDGRTSVADAVILLRAIAGNNGNENFSPDASDMDGDGDLTTADVVAILQFMLNKQY